MWSVFWGLHILRPVLAFEVFGTLTHNNSPLADATLYLFNERQQYYQSASDANGDFQFSAIPTGAFRLLAIPSNNDNALSLFYPNQVEYCDAQPIIVTNDSNISMNLGTGQILNGQVSLDAPFEDALLIANPTNSGVRIVRTARSAADGSFQILGLPIDQDVRLSVEHEHLPEQWLQNSTTGTMTYDSDEAEVLDSSSLNDFYALSLKEGIHIEGLVHSGSTTIANAIVTIYSNSQITSTTTDEWGTYTISGLPPGEVLSWATADGFATTYSPNDDRPSQFHPVLNEGEVYSLLDIDMPVESTISIELLDSITEEPITGASVLIYNDTRTVGRGQPVNGQGIATIDALHAGDYQVYVYAENDGYFTDYIRDIQGEPIWLELTEQEDAHFTYYLDRTENILGEAVDDEGNPIVGVQLIATQGEHFHRASSDGFGEFIIFGLENTSVEITASIAPICPNDTGYIPSFEQPLQITLPQEDAVELMFWRDHDQDEIPTFWEEQWGLDPYLNDAAEDPDNDGLSNLEEYHLNLNPLDQDAPVQECGCNANRSVLIPFLLFFTVRRRA